MSIAPLSPSQIAGPHLSPPLSKSGRPQRVHNLPARYRDMFPEPPTPAISTAAVTMPPPDAEAAPMIS
jgi:hypothetical protein